jgi:hypothetical protein
MRAWSVWNLQVTNAACLERGANRQVQLLQYSRVGPSHTLVSSSFQSGCQGNQKEVIRIAFSKSTCILVDSLNKTLKEERISVVCGCAGILVAVSQEFTVFRPDDGGSKLLWNAGRCVFGYTTQQPRGQPSWTIMLRYRWRVLNIRMRHGGFDLDRSWGRFYSTFSLPLDCIRTFVVELSCGLNNKVVWRPLKIRVRCLRVLSGNSLVGTDFLNVGANQFWCRSSVYECNQQQATATRTPRQSRIKESVCCGLLLLGGNLPGTRSRLVLDGQRALQPSCGILTFKAELI